MLVVRVTIFARLTKKQNVMKKAKYLIFDWLERFCFESGITGKPTFATNRKFIWYVHYVFTVLRIRKVKLEST